jgi:hypothetical protein
VSIYRTLLGGLKRDLPDDVLRWMADATGEPEEMAQATGGPLCPITPDGYLPRQHKALQIVPRHDVTKGRKPKAVLPLLRGVLHDLPYQRIGLLTHYELSETLLKLLEDPYRLQLAHVSYFGSGESRGTNLWPGLCDALLVFGTPRVGADAVRQHLLRLGKFKAAFRKPVVTNGKKVTAGWGPDYWSGVEEDGVRRTVRCWHYADHDWHAAYCSLVRAELVQAVGRARAILPDGVPVYVVSTENLAPPGDGCDGRNGLPLAREGTFGPLTEAQAKVLGAMRNEKGRRRVRGSTAVAQDLGISRRVAYRHLAELEKAGRVRRAGRKWVISGTPPL